MNMTEFTVWAAKGPSAGRFVLMPDEDSITAATATGGWATALDPGNVLLADYAAPIQPDWVIPGWTNPLPPEPAPPSPVPVLSLWNTNPAQVVVGSGNIGKFTNGDVVTMAGVPAPNASVNGPHTIANVGVPPNHFELVGVDLSGAPANIGDAGMTATPPAPPAQG